MLPFRIDVVNAKRICQEAKIWLINMKILDSTIATVNTLKKMLEVAKSTQPESVLRYNVLMINIILENILLCCCKELLCSKCGKYQSKCQHAKLNMVKSLHFTDWTLFNVIVSDANVVQHFWFWYNLTYCKSKCFFRMSTAPNKGQL